MRSFTLDRMAVVFTGIADQRVFSRTLERQGSSFAILGFPDHHRYTTGDFSKIFGSASEHGAEVIITTAKDSVRIPLPFSDALAVAEIGIDFGPTMRVLQPYARPAGHEPLVVKEAISSLPDTCFHTTRSNRP